MDINTLFEEALLADAAYVELDTGMSVKVLVSYVDLENALLKVAEIYQFINQLIEDQKGISE